MRRPSSLARAIRAMTAVITVWCVGCSGFEPLLDSALGADASVMTCGADGGPMGAATMSTASTGGEHGQSSVSPAVASHHGFDCGCGSCHSVAPSTWAFQSLPAAAPAPVCGRVGLFVSVVQAPLLPPPQPTA